MSSQQRYLAVDLLKGIGVIYLIFLHHVVWLFIENDSGGLLYPEAYRFVSFFYHSILGYLGGQIPLLAGATFFIHLRRRPRALPVDECENASADVRREGKAPDRGLVDTPTGNYEKQASRGKQWYHGQSPWGSISLKRKKTGFIEVLKRAVALIVLGFAMNCLTWGWHEGSYLDDIFDWDALQFIALSMVVTYPFIKYLPDRSGIGLVLMLGFLALTFSSQFPLSGLQDSYLYSIIIGDVSGENYWPLCPWFILFAWGIFIGKILSLEDDGALKKLMWAGLVFLALAIFSGGFIPPTNIDNIWGPSLFKPSPFLPLGVMSFSSVTIAVLSISLKRFHKAREKLERSYIAYFGQAVLWVYIISTVVGYNITCWVSAKYRLNFSQALTWLPFLVLVSFLVSYAAVKFLCARKKVFYEKK